MNRISIITINKDNRDGLKRSIDSVARQSVKPFEFIVIDGDSTDGSKELLASSEIVSRFVSEKDRGIYDAMNKGVLKAAGDYIYFLNSGDQLYSEDVLKKLSEMKFSEDIVYGNFVFNDETKTKLVPPSEIDVPFFITGTLWHPCVLTRSDVFTRIGNFDLDFKIAGDYEFLIRALIKNGLPAKYIDVTLSLFDTRGISNNPDSAQLERRERKLAWEKNFSPVVIQCFEAYTRVLRSREYRIGRMLKKIVSWGK